LESIKGINSGEFIIANCLQNMSCLLATSVSKQYRSHISLIKSTSLPFTWNILDKAQNQADLSFMIAVWLSWRHSVAYNKCGLQKDMFTNRHNTDPPWRTTANYNKMKNINYSLLFFTYAFYRPTRQKINNQVSTTQVSAQNWSCEFYFDLIV